MMMAAAWRGSEMTLEPGTTLEEATPEEATRPGIKKRLTCWRKYKPDGCGLPIKLTGAMDRSISRLGALARVQPQ